MLSHLLLTFQHRAGVSSYTSSFDLAQTCVFGNSCLGRFPAAASLQHPFSRSYGVNLPSSLTTLLPLALESSSYLPVSVCGTGTSEIHMAFLATFHAGLRYLFPSITTGTNSRLRHFRCVPMLNSFGGDGISTVCASATPSASP